MANISSMLYSLDKRIQSADLSLVESLAHGHALARHVSYFPQVSYILASSAGPRVKHSINMLRIKYVLLIAEVVQNNQCL